MELVLGLSITSAAIRFVLVEGATGEGATVDKGTLELDGTDGTDGALDDLVDAVLGEGPFAAVPGQRPRAIGVTWLSASTAQGAALLELLAAHGADNVIAVSESDAAAALATGIGDLAGVDDLAVCVVEPDSAVAAVVDAHEVLVDVVDRYGYGDADELADWMAGLTDGRPSAPESVYVLGTAADLDDVVAAMQVAGFPVISAADADLALARGAALASARSTFDLAIDPADGAAHARRRPLVTPRMAALGGVLAAAVVTFVVSVSVALTPDATPEHQQAASASEQAVKAARPEPVEKLPPRPAPAARPAVDPPPQAPPPAPEALPVEPVEAAPEAPAAVPDVPAALPEPQALPEPVPAYEPPAPVAAPPVPAYVPPAPAPVPAVEGVPPGFVPGNPAYVPPGPDGTVPPVQQPQPRLRDRIIERLPIINRFHTPQG